MALQVVGPDDQKDANQTWHWTAAIHISISVHIYIYVYIYIYVIYSYIRYMHCIALHYKTWFDPFGTRRKYRFSFPGHVAIPLQFPEQATKTSHHRWFPLSV